MMERLSGLDASFLYLETPQMHMHVALCAVLDPSEVEGGYDFNRIQRLIAAKVHLLPPFRRRLVDVPLELHHPVWIDDPDFDIIQHVRRVVCPAPGGPEELGALCGRICSTPLDRSRPLWEAWIIEGLEDGRFAMLVKVHHSAVDGQSGASLLVHLFSLTPDVTEPEAPVARPEPAVPSQWEMVKGALAERWRQPKQLYELARKTVANVQEVVQSRKDPEAIRGGTPLTAPRTSFNGALTAKRNVAFARLPLERIKEVKNAFGCTVNDVVLAVTAGALRRYLDGRGELPSSPLVAVCPISVGAVGPTDSANQVSAMFTSLATDKDEPGDRLRAIRESTRGAKHEHNAIGADLLQNWAQFAAPTTFHLASRFYASWKLADKHRPIHNLVISNVPGPPFSLYLGGARLVAIYPIGPVLEGAGLNVSVISYTGNVDFGFMVAADLVPDVWDLADAVQPALEELLAAAHTKRIQGNSLFPSSR